ncbi:unnamed protein product [Caenorhabditis bovis]|uniref:BZIP domain-containing protein n=1 Tax=Caenorhabditis bovis TaxID=2654633 RepID=A0A8S1FF19_9PELO|nr:unnamed protein product [Caenorhabditis bovis]
MWPPTENICQYSYLDHNNLSPHVLHEHYHHNHYPHTSQNNYECFQTLSCPSDLPVETSFNNYTDLNNYWCPPEDHCAHKRCQAHWHENIPEGQSKIFEEISKECEHFLKQADCEKCKIRHQDGGEEAIPIDDLVEIVMQTVDNIKDQVSPKNSSVDKKREQNKVAAARYRDKQKARWKGLLESREKEEKRNVELKSKVKKLEEEVDALRKKFLMTITQ